MKQNWILPTLVCILFLIGGQAQAANMHAEIATEAAPEVSIDSVEIGTPFSIDIYMQNTGGVKFGGSMPLAFYGTDGLTNITHNDVGGVFQGGPTNGNPILDGSVTTHNGWDAKWAMLNQWAEFSWDGLEADTLNWTGATFSPWGEDAAPIHQLSFHFDISEPGSICVDSVSVPNQTPAGKYDWLFDDPGLTFGGPYCFKVYDPNAVSNTAPEFTAMPNPEVSENDNLSFSVSASDPESDALAFTHSGLPIGASFTDNGDGTASIDWTPTFEQSGAYPVSFYVSDGELHLIYIYKLL